MNVNFLTNVLAQSTPVAPPSTEPWWAQAIHNPLGLMILMFGVLYLFVFRNKGKADTERKKMLEALSKGDRIQTIGGILGTVIEARESDVLVKVDESNNTKIRFSRSAIHRVLEDGKAVDTK